MTQGREECGVDFPSPGRDTLLAEFLFICQDSKIYLLWISHSCGCEYSNFPFLHYLYAHVGVVFLVLRLSDSQSFGTFFLILQQLPSLAEMFFFSAPPLQNISIHFLSVVSSLVIWEEEEKKREPNGLSSICSLGKLDALGCRALCSVWCNWTRKPRW